MKILQMRYFKATCEFNSISKAAKKYDVSQPAISSALKELEEEFGLNLFIRNNNRLKLTEDGKYFYHQVSLLLEQIDLLDDRMKDRGKRLKLISIGVPPIIGTFIFPKLVNGFSQNNPSLQFSITETGSLKVLNLIENGKVDLGIVSYYQEVDKKFEYVELVNTEFVFAVSKNHPFAKRNWIRFEDLDNQQIILYAVGSYQDRVINQKFEEKNVKPQIFLHSSSLATIYECLSYGTTGAFLHREILDMYKDLVGIKLVEPIKVKIGIVYSKVTGLLSNAQSFVDYCKEVYKLRK